MAERPAGTLNVKLERMKWDPGIPWGLGLVEGTLLLRECTAGSVAALCPSFEELYLGKELDSINGLRVL